MFSSPLRMAFGALATAAALLAVSVDRPVHAADPTDEPPIVAPPVEQPTTPTTNPTDEPPTMPPVTPVDPNVPETPGTDLVATQPAFLVNVSVDHADGKYGDGDTLSVTFQTEVDSHIYLLYHLCDGTSVMLYPNKAHPDSLAKAKTPITIPPPGEKFRFRVQAPFGVEALQVLASVDKIESLESLDLSVGAAIPISKETIDTIAANIKAEPTRFAEHRVRIESHEGLSLPPPRQAARVGVFIGVSEYTDPKSCEPHEEFRRSAERTAAALVGMGGVDPERAKLLVGKDATRANIEEAIFHWLPSVSQPGDTVFIFYAGHGGRVDNEDGTEADGYDELITTYDNDVGEVSSLEEYNARTRETCIVDDVLARWVQEMPGRQIVMLLDTCHGGGQVDAKSLNEFFAEESARVKDISQLNTIVVTGCGPDESVYFSVGDSNELWMSFFFREAMNKLPRPVTVQQAFEHYRQRLPEILRQYEGDKTGVEEPSMVDSILLPVVLRP